MAAEIKQRPDLKGTLRSLEVGEQVMFPSTVAKITALRAAMYRIPDKKFSISEKGLVNEILVTRKK